MSESSKTNLQDQTLALDEGQMSEDPPSLDDAFFDDDSLDWDTPDSTTQMPTDYAAKALRSAKLKALKKSLRKRRGNAQARQEHKEKFNDTAELPRGYAESILEGMVDLDKVAPGGWEESDDTAVLSNVQSGVHVEHLLGSIDKHIEPEDEAPPEPSPPKPPPLPPEPEPEPEPVVPVLEAQPVEVEVEPEPPRVVKRVKPLDKPGRDAESMILMAMAAVLLLAVVAFLVYSLTAIIFG